MTQPQRYSFVITGSATESQTWTTSGEVTVTSYDFLDVPNEAMLQTFQQLTRGKAVYGKPGVGCRGPYTINSMTITRVDS